MLSANFKNISPKIGVEYSDALSPVFALSSSAVSHNLFSKSFIVFVGPNGALAIGLIAGVVCLWGVHSLKRLLGADDALDVFGVHGVGGILGALLTGVFAAPSLGGLGIWDSIWSGR